MDPKAESLKEKIAKNRWLYAIDGIVGGIVNGLPMVLFSAVLYAARRVFDACVFGVMLYVVLTSVFFPEGGKMDDRLSQGLERKISTWEATQSAGNVEKVPGDPKGRGGMELEPK